MAAAGATWDAVAFESALLEPVEGEEFDEDEAWTEDIPEDDYQEGDDEILQAFFAAKAKLQKRGLRPLGKPKGFGRSTGKCWEENKKTSKGSDCGKMAHWRGDPVCENVKTGQTQPFNYTCARFPQTVM
eukprot:3480490-Amphidinium_carterae.1